MRLRDADQYVEVVKVASFEIIVRSRRASI
jgi:hypothetical protein